MTVFLTSSPTGPLDGSRSVNGLDDRNGFTKQLRRRWPEDARCLYITADPIAFSQNDWIRQSMSACFKHRDFPIAAFDIWDDRRLPLSARELSEYSVLILGGGHVPTQNSFFRNIRLREKLVSYKGLILAVSAGSMNSADEVYVQPELPGESIDPGFRRFLPGLKLTKINILPHYQMVKDSELDGKRLFEDITYGDSYGQEFLALPDGSYLLAEQGSTFLFGEAYRIASGHLSRICSDGEMIKLP